MNESVRRKLAEEKRKIDRRLEAAAETVRSQPMLEPVNIQYEVADKTRAIAHGGIGVIHRLVQKTRLAQEIDEALHLFRVHKPYHESDHVLSIAYNALCGGHTLDDLELRRRDRTYLDAIGARSIPDPTTAGDFCRRFSENDVCALMGAINAARLRVWKEQPPSFTAETARIDADGTIVGTHGECKEGMDLAYNGIWGYSTLLVSLANTGEPLFLRNRPGSRPSHEGVVPLFDQAISLCRRAGFKDVLLRGDTDFSITTAFDRWTDEGVRFVFGYDAAKNLVETADTAEPDLYTELLVRAEREIKTRPRARPENVKEQIVVARGYKNIKLQGEDVVDFDYTPRRAKKTYRVVALRKNLSVERGEAVLFEDIRYFFYITNDLTLTADDVVHEARARCNQENLIEQLKNGPRALRAPVNTLVANWAYMVMSSLAWSLKAWAALFVPVHARWRERHEEERRRLLRMDFRTFVGALITMPAQIVLTGRRIVYRLLSWTRWQTVLLRLHEAI